MLQTTLNNPYKFKVNIRPVKIAYFVKEHDLQSWANLVRLVCTQWGGIRHMIIPVGEKSEILPLYKSLLELHEPDWFITYWKHESNDELRNNLLNYLKGIFPYRQINLQSGNHFEKHDETAHSLHVIPSELLRENHLLTPKIVSGNQELVSLFLYGEVYPGQESYYNEQTNVTSQEVHFGSNLFWESQFNFDPFTSIINLTSYGITAYEVQDGLSGFDYIDIVLIESSNDLCLFWNLRTLREVSIFKQSQEKIRRTICLPLELLQEKSSLDSLFAYIKETLYFPGRRANLDIQFYCTTPKGIKDVQTTLSEIDSMQPFADDRIKGNPVFFGQPDKGEKEIPDRPLTYKFGQVNSPRNYFEGIWWNLPDISILRFGQNELRFDPPTDYHNLRGGEVAIDYECDVWNRYPQNHKVAEAIEKNGWFSRYGISMVGRLPALSQFRRFKLPTEKETIDLFFKGKGYSIRHSKIDSYSRALIDLLGGIQNVKLLTSNAVYQLLDILAIKSSHKIAQKIGENLKFSKTQIEELSNQFVDLELPEELKDIPRTVNQLSFDHRLGLKKSELLELIDSLTQTQLLKRGFYLACPNCGTFEWYPLQTVSEYIICPGCSHRFVLPAKESKRSDHEMLWRYRLNTILNRIMDQDALVAILSTYHLTNGKLSACHSFGLELIKDYEAETDLDFFFVLDQKTYAGECKTGEKLREKDLRTASMAAKLGIDQFYFCTVRQFDSDTIINIDNLKSELKEAGLKTQICILSGDDLLANN